MVIGLAICGALVIAIGILAFCVFKVADWADDGQDDFDPDDPTLFAWEPDDLPKPPS